ncbi:HAD family phosphatase [Haloferax mediterranei ATCC 33500]|uniref:HAD family phosphatase n=1 Tax=Haloferax mediterranei (strain ATCC 33500 / DSM 1411 / JCM 8866 / NBRC 14739 / NCIMB 2177 / R-4) TaxID=523841 RepID=I3R8Q2_HALMT|nr:HAD family phosphatase [Haloferax mediterranei]AFK20612.1 putative haloacid dehalogenase-like hydrolase [Haloferax mediterranei ATCC 33500]AHZ22903.1 haloacid dehalogenase [Haloferax mediterranei ATCC 33500]EMA03070.1 putative haloacid dehalogenase-like hydrolase [Haloferax mediterranei ATCC 33500]MDX5987750.1 HAD family phosphatase [Haloferax mediterranei ATCC 33500]QCQ74230.1 HAD family phosphatase [Haloferax mediterranei ATCC 33500]
MDANVVLFDMDGVLVDSEQYWHAFEDDWVFAEAIESGDPAHEEITGMSFREIYEYLDEQYGATVSKDEFIAAYHENAEDLYGENVVLMDGAEALFSDLRTAGKKAAIVSSAPQAWISTVRERFDLGPLDLVLSADDIDKPGKPEPHIYEHAAAELGVAAEDCIVVEDSVNGIEAAARSGAYTIAYRVDHNAELDLSLADEIVDGPEELRAALLGEN